MSEDDGTNYEQAAYQEESVQPAVENEGNIEQQDEGNDEKVTETAEQQGQEAEYYQQDNGDLQNIAVPPPPPDDNEGGEGEADGEGAAFDGEAGGPGHRVVSEIFIKGLSERTNNTEIEKLFERHGEVTQLVRFSNKNYCFVYMKNEDEAQAAVIMLNGHSHNDKTWEVEATGACNGYNPRKIVLSNLARATEARTIKTALKDYGPVLEVTIHADSKTSCKAFVVVAEEDLSKKAVEELQETDINGKNVTISEASNRQVRRWLERRRGVLPPPKPNKNKEKNNRRNDKKKGGVRYGTAYPNEFSGNDGGGYSNKKNRGSSYHQGGMVWQCSHCGSTEGRLVKHPYGRGGGRFDYQNAFYNRQSMWGYGMHGYGDWGQGDGSSMFGGGVGGGVGGKRKQPLLNMPQQQQNYMNYQQDTDQTGMMQGVATGNDATNNMQATQEYDPSQGYNTQGYMSNQYANQYAAYQNAANQYSADQYNAEQYNTDQFNNAAKKSRTDRWY